MTDLDLPISFLGRPVKPIAMGLMLWCLGIVFSRYDNIGDNFEVIFSVIFNGVTAVVLMVSWLLNKPKWSVFGLFLASFAAFNSMIDVFLRAGFDSHLLTNLSVVIIAVGSAALEKMDPRGHYE